MDEKKMEEHLRDILEVEPITKSINTFSEEGVLTMNKGLVLALDDGSEFHITIQKTN